MQPVSLKGNSITKDSAFNTINRFNIFPIARFAYNFSRSKTFNANYSGSYTEDYQEQSRLIYLSGNTFLGCHYLRKSIELKKYEFE
mgnify:CR=1 FL=1